MIPLDTAIALLETARPVEAREILSAHLRAQPHDENAWNLLGKAHVDLLELDTAEAAFSRAMELAVFPQTAQYHRGLCRLLRGDFARGWIDYEKRLFVPEFRPRHFSKPRWEGEDLCGGRLLVLWEQGFGDMFQFSRYLKVLDARGIDWVMDAQPEVLPLFARSFGAERIVPLILEREPQITYDSYVHLMSLPGIFGTTADTVPCPPPYLVPNVARAAEMEALLPPRAAGLRVGCAWSGRPTHPQDALRSAPARVMAGLAGLPGVQLLSLQPSRTGWPDDLPFESVFAADLRASLHNWEDVCAIMPHLDLIVTIDGAIGHLAGAMGIPVWLMLHPGCDFRWMLERIDSPWYLRHRLFRQPAAGDWRSVFGAVRNALLMLGGARTS